MSDSHAPSHPSTRSLPASSPSRFGESPSAPPLRAIRHQPVAPSPPTASPRPKLLTPKQLCALYPIKPRTLRHWIQHSVPRHVSRQGHKHILPGNGLASAILRKGRLIFIDEHLFLAWLYDRNPPP